MTDANDIFVLPSATAIHRYPTQDLTHVPGIRCYRRVEDVMLQIRTSKMYAYAGLSPEKARSLAASLTIFANACEGK